jgi:peptide/nickel transport system substrate-binding protein
MTSRGFPFSLMLAVFSLIAGACGGSTAPTSENTPYVAKSWPEAGPIECEDGVGGLAQVRSISELTVEFQLCAPDPGFIQKVSLANFNIQDSGYLAAHAASGQIVNEPNGTGPWRLKAWELGEQIVLERFNDYWGPQAAAPTAVLQWQQDAAARLVALRAGTADGIDNVSPDDAEAIDVDASLSLISRVALNTMYLGMSNAYPPFDDVRVRTAVALALDRQRIVDLFYPAGSAVASHYVPCGLEFACEGDAWFGQDVAAAKALLAEAGFPEGFSTTISLRDVVRSYLPNPQAVATDLQSQLAAIGIDATIDVQEPTTFFDSVLGGKIPGLFLFAWVPDYPDTLNFVLGQFGRDAGPTLGATYETIDALATEASVTADSARRKAIYAEVNRQIKELVPFVPIAHGGSAVAFRADVEGAHTSPLLLENFAAMKPSGRDTLVFVQGAEPAGLYCADEADFESIRACAQFGEGLYGFATGTAIAEPRLATSCSASADLLTWTCTLREGVRFHNGALLDATDVVDTYASIWDCAHPLHVGRTSTFMPWSGIWGSFLSPDECIQPTE